MKDLFYLNKDITFLNHGSFGACPKPIFEEYQKWQLELEKEPVQFITVEAPKQLKLSREALANFLSCHADDLVYVQNPSTAFNIIIKNLKLNAGDEILTTNHEYGAMDRTWNYYCRKAGAKYVQQKISSEASIFSLISGTWQAATFVGIVASVFSECTELLLKCE